MRTRNLFVIGALAILAWAARADNGPLPPTPLKERTWVSKHPLYFRLVFDRENRDSMLGVIDESTGNSKGYDVAYIDENMNGDLTDEQAKEFPRTQSGPNKGSLKKQFAFKGSFKGAKNVPFTVKLNDSRRSQDKNTEYGFWWSVVLDQRNYWFISGRMHLFESASAALNGQPVRLDGEFKWEITSRVERGNVIVSAGLRDGNGAILRGVTAPVAPLLTLVRNDQVVVDHKKMEFG